MEIQLGGIKCDNKDCGYRDDSIVFDQYRDFINKPCPKCGENLLTQEDFDLAEQLHELQGMMEGLPPELLDSILKAANPMTEDERKAATDELLSKYGLGEVGPDTMLKMSMDSHNGLSIESIEVVDPID